jgi:elongation factor Ts
MGVTIEDIKRLRTMTGAGLSACKDALAQADSDFDKAMEIIREKGQAIAAKRSDRSATEGCVLGGTNGKFAATVALKCETDFVASNADFIKLTQQILDAALKEQPADLEALKNVKIGNDSIAQMVTDRSGITGEKLELDLYTHIEGESVYVYIHPGNKLVATVAFNQPNTDSNVMKEVAMQVAAMNPVAISPAEVPADILEEEKKIAKDKAREAGKPENLLDRIAEGSLNKYYKEYTLLNQEYTRDTKINMAQFMDKSSKGLTVTAFKRVTLNAE